MPVSLAVLGDDDRWWRPEQYLAGIWRCSVKFSFPVAKLTNFHGQEQELERSANPFAVFVLAHLKTLDTQGKPDTRLAWKLRIAKGLYDRGMSGPEVRKLFRLVDWVMTLSPPLARTFSQDMEASEKEKQMPFITSTEQVWLEDGIAQGRAETMPTVHAAIEMCLKLRFGSPGLDLMPRVREVKEPATLEAFLKAIETSPDLDTLAALLSPPSPA